MVTPPSTSEGGVNRDRNQQNSEALLQRHSRDRLQDTTGDLVRVALRVWTAVFQVSLVAVVHEAVRDADGSATICDAVVEFVDRLRFMQSGEAEVIIRPVDGDVL